MLIRSRRPIQGVASPASTLAGHDEVVSGGADGAER
jgi:hypothetical protein